MAKKKTGIGFEAIFEEPTGDKSASEQGRTASETAKTKFDLSAETLDSLEAAQNFVSWLVGQMVSQQLIIEVALKIILDELEAKGKDSQLAKEIARVMGTTE